MEGIYIGLINVLCWQNLTVILLGTIGGIAIGALPGLSSTMGVALLIPLTFAMPPETGLSMLAGIYCGSVYGGSITAILIRTPGTDASVATSFDGYELTKQGKGGKTLGASTFASFVGGIFSTIALLFLAPPLAKISIKFGPPEFFFLAIFGLTIIVTLSSKALLKGLIAGFFGLILSIVGMDPVTAYPRFSYNNALLDGIPLLPALIGLFSISQALIIVGRDISVTEEVKILGRVIPSIKEIVSGWVNYIRSSIIGVIVGIIPGAGTGIASFIAYNEAKRFSKTPEKFGKGEIQGVIASETANNAVTGASLVPLLTLGIPGNAVAAVFLGGLTIHGLIPGMNLFTKHADITYTLILALGISNIVFLIIGLVGAGHFCKLAKTPNKILAPTIIVLSVIGSYAIRNNIFDIFLTFGFGIIGYFFEKYEYPSAPIVLALILGPIAEAEFLRSVQIFGGRYHLFFTRPLCLVLLFLILASLLFPIIRSMIKK